MFDSIPYHAPSPTDSELRDQLVRRRRTLAAVRGSANPDEVARSIDAIDAAIRRVDTGIHRICERCNGLIDDELLVEGHVGRVCIDCLTDGERQLLEHDLSFAGRIQSALLPDPAFAHGGWDGYFIYRPLGAVGGDFCDVIHTGDTTVAFLGDVSGKGIAAALLMSHLSAIFRALVDSSRSLVEIVTQANRMLSAASPSGSFATLAAARLEHDGTVEITNAGHVPPLIHNGRIEELPPHGIPLGIFSEASYDSQTIMLNPGERLVMLTDGLTESTDQRGRELGLTAAARLVASFPDDDPRRLADRLMQQAARHRGAGRAHDDSTVMVIRRVPG